MSVVRQRIFLKGVRALNQAWPILSALVAWEILARMGVIRTAILPPPTTILLTGATLIRSGILLSSAAASLTRVAAGFAIAVCLGCSGGVLIGFFPTVSQRIAPLLDLLRPIPPIAWIPLAILWFGLGAPSAVFIVTVGAFFPICLSTYRGIQSISQGHINAARCLGAGTGLIITDVLIPAAMPQILIGLRVGMGIAWTSVIAAEMVGVHNGLGYAIQLNRTMLETEAVMVNMIVIGIIGWSMNEGVGWLERRITHWNQDTIAASAQS